MINFFHNHLPQAVLFDLGVVKIYYYGLLFVLAFLVGYFLISKLSKIKKVESYHLYNLVFYLLIFGLIGARLYHIFFYNFEYFSQNIFDIIKIWQGGLAIQGAIIASIITVFIYCRKYKLSFWRFSDILVIPFSLAQAIGRWGNYFNQEVYGLPTDKSWGIPIELQNRVEGFENFQYFQPTFFYESVLNFLLFLVLLIIFFKKKLSVGTLTLVYLIGYSVIRFFMEFIRLDPTFSIFSLRFPQVVSLLIMFGSLLFVFLRSNKYKNNTI